MTITILRIPKYTAQQQQIRKSISIRKTCQCCNKKYVKQEQGINFKKCAKCQNAWYCSKKCQKADWKTHKKKCGNIGVEPSSESQKFGNAVNIHIVIEGEDTVLNREVGMIWTYLDEDEETYIIKTIEFEEFKSYCMENGLGHVNFDYFTEELKTRNVFVFTPSNTVF